MTKINTKTETNNFSVLQVLGTLSLVFAAADFILSWMGVNLTSFMGPATRFSPIIFGVIGTVLINLNKKSTILFVSDNTILVEFFKTLNTNATGLNNFDLDNIILNYKKVILYFDDYSNDQKKNLDIIQRIVKSKISYRIHIFSENGIRIIRFNKMLNFFSKLKYFYF